MTKTTDKTISFDEIVNIGQKRVDDTKTVYIPAMKGAVKLRQISGAEHDAAVAKGNANGFDSHLIGVEQIKASIVEPALPEAQADDIINNLPYKAFGQLQAAVWAVSGIGDISIEELTKSFRATERAERENADGSDSHNAGNVNESERVGTTDTEANDGASSLLPSDESDTPAARETTSDAGKTKSKNKKVTS